MSDPLDVDGFLADLRNTSNGDQIDAALRTLARVLARYYALLLEHGLPIEFALALVLEYQRIVLSRAGQG